MPAPSILTDLEPAALPREFLFAAGFGMIPGYSTVKACGNNPDIDTGTLPEDIWTGGGAYPWLTAATSLEIVSASANDAAAGTGARTVTIYGLDGSYEPVVQTVTLNGVSAVAIPTQLLRINYAQVATTGSGHTNAGDLAIRDAGGGATRGILQAGYGVSRQAIYTVPAGHSFALNRILLSVNRPSSARDVTVAFYFGFQDGTFVLPIEMSVDGNPFGHDCLPGVFLPEKTDFAFRCMYVSATNTDLTAAFTGILRNNNRS